MFSLKSMAFVFALLIYFPFTLTFATAEIVGPKDGPPRYCPIPPRPTDAPKPTDGPKPTHEPGPEPTDAPPDVYLQGGGSYFGNVFAWTRYEGDGPVCDDGWGCNEANVVCRQLGFDFATISYSGSTFGQVSNVFVMDDVSCRGYERHLQDCSYHGNDDCDYSEGAGVECWMWEWDLPTDRPNPDEPTDGPTPRPTPRPTDEPTDEPTTNAPTDCPTPSRPTDGPKPKDEPGPVPTDAPPDVELHGGSSYYGNVFATNRNYEFGPVCDDSWGCDEANVVCRQLGFDYATKSYGDSTFGQVSSNFAMDDVSCRGYERHLQDCSYNTHDNCGPGEGAGVKCWMWDWDDRPTDSPTERPTHRPTDVPTTERPSPGTCPHGWLDADYLGCFKLVNEGGIMWPMAQQVCEDYGGFLAQPDTDEKHQLLASFIEIDETYEGYANWWIGLTDQGHEEKWEWAHSGEFLDSHEDHQWGHGSPHQDDNNHNDCVILRHSDGYRWADVDCFADSADGIRNAFICEREN